MPVPAVLRRSGGTALRAVLRAPTALYRRDLGWVLGHRFCALTHVGRRSGRRYTTVLEVLQYRPDSRELAVLSGFGRRSDWLRNIEAGPAVRVQVGRESFPPEHRVLPPAEAAAVLADYEDRNRFSTPVLRPVLSRLAGFRYDGSPAARQRLVQQLPVVLLWPATGPGR